MVLAVSESRNSPGWSSKLIPADEPNPGEQNSLTADRSQSATISRIDEDSDQGVQVVIDKGVAPVSYTHLVRRPARMS